MDTKRQLVATMPATAPGGLLRSIRFSADDRSLVWATDTGVWRWPFANSGAIASIYQAPSRIVHAAVAASGAAAYVHLGGSKALVVDIATGKTTPAPASYSTAISPSGARLARGAANLDVIDVASGKTVWSTKLASPTPRIIFGDTDDDLAYQEANRIRVAKLPAAPTALPSTSRFAGWLSPGIAAIARGDSLRAYTFASRSWSAAESAALADKPVEHAPGWASWITSRGLDGVVGAERSERRAASVGQRDQSTCAPKLRVWTPKGGQKTLVMACSKPEHEGAEDPGWELGGGWAVGVSSSKAVVYEARSGRKVTELHVPPAVSRKPEFASAYWQAAVSPSGDWLALIWRRPVLDGEGGSGPDPREDAMHIAETAERAQCVTVDRGCLMLYTVELWTLKGAPHQVWQSKLEREVPGSGVSVPANPSGALAFDRTGAHLLMGFDDGEVRVVSTARPDAVRSERLVVAPIRAIAPDSSGQWVEVEDGAGDQRVWQLVP